jgi:hypothetical protein
MPGADGDWLMLTARNSIGADWGLQSRAGAGAGDGPGRGRVWRAGRRVQQGMEAGFGVQYSAVQYIARARCFEAAVMYVLYLVSTCSS